MSGVVLTHGGARSMIPEIHNEISTGGLRYDVTRAASAVTIRVQYDMSGTHAQRRTSCPVFMYSAASHCALTCPAMELTYSANGAQERSRSGSTTRPPSKP
eukprot:1695933-Rhodomonas_salina.2